jgi:hypothetical protein
MRPAHEKRYKGRFLWIRPTWLTRASLGTRQHDNQTRLGLKTPKNYEPIMPIASFLLTEVVGEARPPNSVFTPSRNEPIAAALGCL